MKPVGKPNALLVSLRSSDEFMTAFEDRIALLVQEYYDRLPRKGKPSPKSFDWTVLAAFVLHDRAISKVGLD